ncbi:MAG: 16S rRNA (guanine(527)-N(7))-methyltransferase RsmG [Lysobacterales bacterium]
MDIQPAWQARLTEGLDALSLALPAAAQTRLLEYIALLLQWNSAYNLTAVREPLAMIDRHLIDSLAILPYARDRDLADIGSGPGIPGLVLALVQPYERVWLVDSNGKKARFLRECVRRFGLTHCSVHEQRSESLRADPGFTQVVSRAYAELADFVRSTRALLAPGGCWLAMKGKYPEAEIARLPADVRLSSSLRLQVPGADGERHLLTLHPTV